MKTWGLKLAGLGRTRPWTVWALTRVFGLAGVYGLGLYGLHGVIGTSADVLMYGSWAWLFQHGHMPYLSDYSVVYPPGILPFLVLPALKGYLYQAEFLTLAVLTDAYVFHRLRSAGSRAGAWLWVFGALLVGPVFWARLDLFLAAALVLAVLAYVAGRPDRAAFWLGCAAALKVWPILLLIPLALVVTGRRRRRSLALGLAVPVALTIPVAAWGGLPGLWESLRLQSGRGVEIESVFALPVELARRLDIWSVLPHVALAWEFDGHVGSVLGGIATLVLVIGVIGWMAAVLLRRRVVPFPMGQLVLLLAATLVATAKVLSPQYALWVLAGAAVVCDHTRFPRRLVLSTGAFLLSTQALFPFAYRGLILGSWPATLVALVHAGAVMALLLAVGASLPPPVGAVVPADDLGGRALLGRPSWPLPTSAGQAAPLAARAAGAPATTSVPVGALP